MLFKHPTRLNLMGDYVNTLEKPLNTKLMLLAALSLLWLELTDFSESMTFFSLFYSIII